MRAGLFMALAAIMALAGCADPNRPEDDGVDNGSMSANLNGFNYSASPSFPASLTNGTLSFGGSHVAGGGNTKRINITLTDVSGTGTHTLNLGTAGEILYTDAYGLSTSYLYSTKVAGASGSITITSLTATRVAGTFSGTLQPVAGTGASGEKLVTGNFNVVIGS